MLLVKVEGGTNLLCSASFLVIYQCQLPLLQMSVGLGAYLRAPALHVNQGSSASPFGTVWMSAATHVNLCFWAAFAFIHLNQGLVCVSLDLTCVSIKKVSCPAQRLTGFQLQLHHGFVNISCSSARVVVPDFAESKLSCVQVTASLTLFWNPRFRCPLSVWQKDREACFA